MSTFLWQSECRGKQNVKREVVNYLLGKVYRKFGEVRFHCTYSIHSAKGKMRIHMDFITQVWMLKNIERLTLV